MGRSSPAWLVATFATRRLGLSDRLGSLIAIGTAICGATAIVAAAPGIRAKEEEVTYAIANITVFGIAAMLLYPFLGNLIFGGDVVQVGLFLGTSIHETAQVAGAGLIYDQSFDVIASPSAADIAIVSKLVRNLLMLVVIPAITYVYVRRQRDLGSDVGSRTRVIDMLPVFILGFVAMAIFRSIGDAAIESGGSAFGIWGPEAWDGLVDGIRTTAEYCLAMAMAAVGLGTSFSQLQGSRRQAVRRWASLLPLLSALRASSSCSSSLRSSPCEWCIRSGRHPHRLDETCHTRGIGCDHEPPT